MGLSPLLGTVDAINAVLICVMRRSVGIIFPSRLEQFLGGNKGKMGLPMW